MTEENPYRAPSGELTETEGRDRPYLVGQGILWANTIACTAYFVLAMAMPPLLLIYPPPEPSPFPILGMGCFPVPFALLWGVVGVASRNVWRRFYLVLAFLPGILLLILWFWTMMCLVVADVAASG